MNRHRVERIVFERDGLVGFGRSRFAVVIGERKVGQQFMRLGELGIELDGLRRVFGGLAVEAIR